MLGVVAMLIVQVVVLCHGYLLAGQAVREGVREAALGANRASIESMVRSIAHRTDGTVTITPIYRYVGSIVEVRYRVAAPVLSLVANAVPELWIETAASMRIEVQAFS